MLGSMSTTPESDVHGRIVKITGERSGRRRVRQIWIQHGTSDWLVALVLGFLVHHFLVDQIPWARTDGGSRLAVYASLAAAVGAFVAVGFTPIAILMALPTGENVARLRRFDHETRLQFLLGELTLIGGAGVLIFCGLFESVKSGSPGARLVATGVLVLMIMKVLRLTQLFWAILAANAKDQPQRTALDLGPRRRASARH